MVRAPAIDLNAVTAAAKPFHWGVRKRSTRSGKVVAHFGDVATPLAEFLAESESVVGCVAWITSPRFVDQLVGKPVSLIVNKEWALRSSDSSPSAVRSRTNLGRLTGGLRRQDFGLPLNRVTGVDTIQAVRCAGHLSRTRAANTPLMHHKFLVRLHSGKAVAVWTGSLNLTVAGELNLENGVEIHDPSIAAAYLDEWARVAAISEPLDFTAGKADPTWTAGSRGAGKVTSAGKRKPRPAAKASKPPSNPANPPKAKPAGKRKAAAKLKQKSGKR